ncbi:MAG: hypothetical protein CVU05_13070 [Bacteroidetes bacterium HGW-Bacteroidetes-21]|nr:MAG: hypothetical protein CVU05_13070 [Bacteroidetes bacterium HGW-Bacteroidetes-21]
MRYVLFLLLVILFSCKNEKLDRGVGSSDFSLTDFYVSQDSSNKLFLKISSAEEMITGYVFSDSGKAVVTRYPFVLDTKTNELRLWAGDSLRQFKVENFTASDTLLEIFLCSESNKKITYRFSKNIIPVFLPETDRYRKPIFDSITVETVTYGRSNGYYTSKNIQDISEDKYPEIIEEVGKSLLKNILMEELPLEMDIYRPKGDTCSQRPLIILIHGGAFVIGDKTSPTVKALAEYYARCGYVVAAPNYRLGFIFVPGAYYYLERCIYRATQDIRAAARYLVNFNNRFGVDTSSIYTAGNSAGGFLALNTALMDNNSYYPFSKAWPEYLLDDLGCPDCSGNQYKNKFSIKGIVNMWGALTHIRMLVDKPSVPILCFHGSDDKIISPDYDFPFANVSSNLSSIFSQKFFGSLAICKFAKVTGAPVKLMMFKGAGHDPHINKNGSFNSAMDTIKKEMSSFLYHLVAGKEGTITGSETVTINDKISVYTYAVINSQYYSWKADGGLVTGYNADSSSVSVVWFRTREPKIIRLCVRNRNDLVTLKSKEIHFR